MNPIVCHHPDCDRVAPRGSYPHKTDRYCTLHDGRSYGPGVCICQISLPAPKCCRTCGYPCVHRMAPHIRDQALAKMSALCSQVVAGQAHRGAA